MKILQKSGLFIRGLAAAAAIMAVAPIAKGVPFASCVTNTGGTISFYLNEPGGNVTVTYGDGTTNASYNGVTTGTNLPAGLQAGFALPGTNTTYRISVQKNGSGSPSLIASRSIGTTRGVSANALPATSAFGRVYDVQGNAGVWLMNSDLSLVNGAVQTGGIGFPLSAASTTFASPCWVSVAPDGSVMVTDESKADSAIYQMAPDFSSAKLFLGPIGGTNGFTSHGIIISPALLTGSTNGNNAVLMTVDGDLGNPGSIQVYNIGSGPLPWTNAPNAQGAQISIPGFTAEALGGNEYIGLTQGPPPNSYIYGSTYRTGPGSANFVTVMDSTGTNVLWSSEGSSAYPDSSGTPPTGDWFFQNPGGSDVAIGNSGSAVSPDGNYLVAMSVESAFVICPLTNGIPNTAAIFTYDVPGSSGATENGRGISWDAADNIIMSSSGFGTVSTWSLGISATAVTTGNLSGTTGFTLIQPATSVSVVATQPFASQNTAPNGTGAGPATPGTFNVYRYSTNGYASAQLVNYVLGGTATTIGGVYTVSGGTTNSVTIPAGQTNVAVTITPTTANVPRLTTTVTLSILGGAGYTVSPPFSDTVTIQNTSQQEIQISAGAPSMYKAFSNDFASVTLTRLGDTNDGGNSYSVTTLGSAGGTAILGTDYTAPTQPTFAPGDITHVATISPLVGGIPPVDTLNPTYVGNLTAIIGLTANGTYLATGSPQTLTSIDNADPPATVLWSDPLDNTTAVTDSNTWVITAANGNMTVDTNDYEVNFGYDITANNPNYGLNGAGFGIVTNPPSGATNVLRITCNKDGTIGCNGGVNAFPQPGTNFSGNYAVRFYMCAVQGSIEASATEGPLFGINHLSLGVTTNWFTGSGFTSELPGYTNNGWADDGVWFWMDSQAGGEADGDYVQFTGISHTFPNTGFSATIHGVTALAFTNNFKYPAPYNTFPGYGLTGIPASESYNASTLYNSNSLPASAWADVEMKQINNIVTLSFDKIPVLVYTNIGGWTTGVPMLGYDDPFNSVQTEDGAAFFSDIRVVRIGPPSITQIVDAGGTVTIRFTTQDGDDTTSSFTLLSSGNTGTALHVDTVVAGTFTQLGSGAFQVTTPATTNKAVFYRIEHN